MFVLLSVSQSFKRELGSIEAGADRPMHPRKFMGRATDFDIINL